MSAALAQTAPVDLATMHRQAQARIQRHPVGVGFHGHYQPLMELVRRAEHFGGALRVDALTACQAAAAADDDTLARMLRDRRPAPAVPTGPEMVDAQIARHQNALAATALARPRVTLAEQLSAMERRGIRIAADGRHLKVHAAPGVVTESDRTLLREHKPEILAWLQGNEETF